MVNLNLIIIVSTAMHFVPWLIDFCGIVAALDGDDDEEELPLPLFTILIISYRYSIH